MAQRIRRRGSLSRRDLMRRAGAASAAVVLPVGATGCLAPGRPDPPEVPRTSISSPDGLETLTGAEADVLDAVVARLIPTDASGPGAREARAVRYIDRALAGPLASSRDAYRVGLAAVDRYAQAAKGQPFGLLSAQDQDAVLKDIEENRADGFSPDAASFFNLVHAHTLQGTFGDPFYGGNTDFVGWDLIGYPGVRIAVGSGDQALDPSTVPTRQSAYDFSMFSRRRTNLPGGDAGDVDGH